MYYELYKVLYTYTPMRVDLYNSCPCPVFVPEIACFGEKAKSPVFASRSRGRRRGRRRSACKTRRVLYNGVQRCTMVYIMGYNDV